MPKTDGYDPFGCLIHANHLIVGFIATLVGLHIISAMYSAALLLRSGGYFLRLVLAVRTLVYERSVPLSAAASEAELQMSRDFIDWCDPPSENPATRKTQESDKSEFLAIFNAGFHNWIMSDHLAHFCTGPTCCKGGWAKTQDRMVTAIVVYLLARRPDTPALSRWTLLTPTARFFLRLLVVHNMLKTLFKIAFDALRAKLDQEVDRADEQYAGKRVDAAVEQEFKWHAASGRRLRDSREFFNNHQTREQLFLSSMLLGVMNLITSALLKSRGPTDAPLLQDLLHPEYSPVWLAMQYLSGLLLFACAHMRLLVAITGCASAAALFTDADRLMHIRTQIETTSAWIYLRHWRYIHGYPWVLVKAADARQSDASRRSVADKLFGFARRFRCCLGRTAAIIKSMIASAVDLLNSIWQRRLRVFAYAVSVHNASIENKHARSGKIARAERVVWAHFVSRVMNVETKSIMKTAIMDAPLLSLPPIVRPPAIADAPATSTDELSALLDQASSNMIRSPIQLYHQYCCARDNATLPANTVPSFVSKS